MMGRTLSMRAKVIKYAGAAAAWHFLVLPKQPSAEIKKKFGAAKRGWGSLPVIVTIGEISWKTSIFPDSKAGAYLLPLKAAIRKKLRAEEGDALVFTLEIDVAKIMAHDSVQNM